MSVRKRTIDFIMFYGMVQVWSTTTTLLSSTLLQGILRIDLYEVFVPRLDDLMSRLLSELTSPSIKNGVHMFVPYLVR